MDDHAKAKFILALHKHSLQAFASGGGVGSSIGGAVSGAGQGAWDISAPSQSGSNNTAGPGGVTLNATNPNTSGIAGNIGNFLGTNNHFQASGADVQSGTNADQLNSAYGGAQAGLAGQQAFANQAAAQNGFGNQSNVFAQQQALANQLNMQAQGMGPNIAQNQLNQATGQNVANQGALMAGQRGAGANVGLMSRQIAQQGAATQQQAAGQAATLGAQQQIAAQQALANQQAQMQHVAGQQVAAQGQGANNFSSGAQGEQNILQNSNTGYNNGIIGMQSNVNNVNAQTAAGNQGMAGKTIGGIASGLSSALGGMMAEGGEVDTGEFKPSASQPSSGPSIPATATNPAPPAESSGGGGGGAASLAPMLMMAAAQGGQVPPGGPQSFVGQWLQGGSPQLAAVGGGIQAGPGQQAVKKDNSYENDKVPALLSQGEIVLPRSITTHPNAPQKAAEFVMAVMNQKRSGKK